MRANPVVVKELRGRMRGWGAAVILTLYLLVVGLLTLLFYAMFRSTNDPSGQQASQIGKFLFSALVIFQVIMVSLLTPAFTAGSITSEKERKTYDVLMITLLRARSVVFGKLGAALAYVLLLILAVAPLESLSFMFGGVSPEEIILSQVVVFFMALLFASVGIFWSSLMRSSVASNVLTYGTILVLMIGIPVVYYTVSSIMGAYTYNPNGSSLQNSTSYFYGSGLVLSSNPVAALVISELFYSRGDPLFIYSSTQMINGKTLLVASPWLVYCAEALILSALLVLISIRLVQPIHYRSSIKLENVTQPDVTAQPLPPPSMTPVAPGYIEKQSTPVPIQAQEPREPV